MTPIKRIILLSAIVAGIVVFWLMPGVNKAESPRYVRYYEDTETPVPNVTAMQTDTTGKKRRKAYRKEVIEPSKKVSGKMFSRAVQFNPIQVTEDTVNDVQAKLEVETKSKEK